jgi:hypothetical protein
MTELSEARQAFLERLHGYDAMIKATADYVEWRHAEQIPIDGPHRLTPDELQRIINWHKAYVAYSVTKE